MCMTGSLWFTDCRQTGSLIAHTVSACWESWHICVRRPWSLTSDSPLNPRWTFTHQSKAILSPPAVICSISSHTVELRSFTVCQRTMVSSRCMCSAYPLCIRPGRVFDITVTRRRGFNGITNLSEANNSRFSSLRRYRATLTYDSLALSRVIVEARINV